MIISLLIAIITDFILFILGSFIPMNLIIPIIIDSMIDGFLIGLSTSIAIRIGFILSLTNTLEMSFLGIALALRVRKCTASHIIIRYFSLITPPITMFCFTFIGLYFGNVAKQEPIMYIIWYYCIITIVIT